MSRKPVTKYETKALDADTWPDFARLVEANNGVWGGCWCMWYHGNAEGSDDSPVVTFPPYQGRFELEFSGCGWAMSAAVEPPRGSGGGALVTHSIGVL